MSFKPRFLRLTLALAPALLVAFGALSFELSRAAETVASVDERGVAMPQSWLQFRLNGEHNPVIDAPIAAAWQVETHGQISASPTVVNGMLYLGTNGGRLYAIDAATGAIRWTFLAHNGLKSNPLIYGGLVIMGEGNADSTTYVPRKRVRVGSGSSGLVALDAVTGRQRWYRPLTGTGQPTATIVHNVLIHHDGDGVVVALDPTSGRLLYQRHVSSVASMVGALPVNAGIIVTTGIFPNRVIGFKRSNGHTVWTWETSRSDSGLGDCPPASDGATIYCDYLTPVESGPAVDPGQPARPKVYALDARSGKLRWVLPLEAGIVPPRNESAIPLLYRGAVFVGSAVAPYVHAIDASSGHLLWRQKVRGSVKGGIVARNGALYFGDMQGYLWALDARTGHVLGVRNTQTSYNVGSPIIVGGSLVIGSNTGRILSIPLSVVSASQDV
jgi:outer membrane protein assembly factor BamB